VDYTLFMVVMIMLMSERVEKHSGATPAMFPPSIFAIIAYVSMLRVSLPPRIAIAEGGLYIGFLGQVEC
jgi:hypothetical protein